MFWGTDRYFCFLFIRANKDKRGDFHRSHFAS